MSIHKPQEVLSREALKGTNRLATRSRDVTPAPSTRERALAPRAIAQLDTLWVFKIGLSASVTTQCGFRGLNSLVSSSPLTL
jgi:hypothetical protein